MLVDLHATHWDAFSSFARCFCPQNMNFAKNYERQHKVKRG